MDKQKERRLLQLAVALACLVPLCAGTAGVVQGISMIESAGAVPDLESHFRYLSGLLLGLGIGFAVSVPTIERRSELFMVLSFTVVVGGLARLCALMVFGMPGTPYVLAFGMELVVVPLLFVWQRRVALAFRS
ncbi:DUF4345 domain-containing protein [Sphingomonas sp.]|uniref:DUF4345 domain-containing protein n=1 Tax=Sphingomonas sp. TaxID=28214 RepID=UPI0017F84B82|nr:DUF4345 domain-containing protein [Sphingomonas sp.]MBA3511263.1 DUF4345 domain-containing protein [Sphingomonas sp.]